MAELKYTQFMKGLPPLLKEHVIGTDFEYFHVGETRWLFQAYYGRDRKIHYEVSRVAVPIGRMLEIGLHFESRDKQLNQFLLDQFSRYILEIREALGNQVVAEMWDRGWTKIYEAYPNEQLTTEVQKFTAERLATFISVIQPLYEHIRQLY